MANIGIKLASGEFYPILEENNPGKKKLTVTTVKDGQTNVHIDLYYEGSDLSSTFMGSLVIDSIEKKEKGSPDIELVMELDDEGNVSAEAIDHVTNCTANFSMNLQSLAHNEIMDIPDFELDGLAVNSEISLDDNDDFSIPMDAPDPRNPTNEPLESFDIEEMSDFSENSLDNNALDTSSSPDLNDFSFDDNPTPKDSTLLAKAKEIKTPIIDDDDFSLPEIDSDFSSSENNTDTISFNDDISNDSNRETTTDFVLDESIFGKTTEQPISEKNESTPFKKEKPQKIVKEKVVKEKKVREKNPEALKPVLIIMAVIFALALLIGASYAVYQIFFNKTPQVVVVSEIKNEEKQVPKVEEKPITEAPKVEETPTIEVKPEVKPVTEEKQAPIIIEEPKPVKKEEPKPVVTVQKGIWYKIKWGDTLWDLSNAYYRNPWLYPIIAKANKIKNANLIIAGKWLWIPPK